MVEYETQASAVMTICHVLLSTLFNNDNQKETGSGVTLDSVREKHVLLNVQYYLTNKLYHTS